MLVPNFPGAKFSIFANKVPNCPFSYLGAKLSVCLFGAKLSVFLSWCQIVLPSIQGDDRNQPLKPGHEQQCQLSHLLFTR